MRKILLIVVAAIAIAGLGFGPAAAQVGDDNIIDSGNDNSTTDESVNDSFNCNAFGGDGGNGGDGGPGGITGDVELPVESDSTTGDANGGAGGAGGAGGNASACNTTINTTTPGPAGPPGKDGAPGASGVSRVAGAATAVSGTPRFTG